MTLRRLMSRFCNGYERPPTFLKTGHTFATFPRLWNHLTFRQWLKRIARTEDNSGLIFLATGIFSRPGSLLEFRLLISLDNSCTVIKIIQSLYTLRRRSQVRCSSYSLTWSLKVHRKEPCLVIWGWNNSRVIYDSRYYLYWEFYLIFCRTLLFSNLICTNCA